MAFKKFRKMKVYKSSGYNYKNAPSIILKGDWLKVSDFDIGGFTFLLRKILEEKKMKINRNFF